MIFSKICISSDHSGYELKEKIKDYLIKKDIPIIDLGPPSSSPVDYPDYAKKVAKRVILKRSDAGILVCGSGTGMAITANKFEGIRAAQCYNKKSSTLSRKHNNANVLCIGSRMIKKNEVFKIINYFFNTKFEGGRHQKRINKINI